MDPITRSLQFDTVVQGEDAAWACVEDFWVRAARQGFSRDGVWTVTLTKSYAGHEGIRVMFHARVREEGEE